MRDDGVRAYRTIAADGDRSDNLRTDAHVHAVTDRGTTVPLVIGSLVADGGIRAARKVTADLRTRIHKDSIRMVNGQPLSNFRLHGDITVQQELAEQQLDQTMKQLEWKPKNPRAYMLCPHAETNCHHENLGKDSRIIHDFPCPPLNVGDEKTRLDEQIRKRNRTHDQTA